MIKLEQISLPVKYTEKDIIKQITNKLKIKNTDVLDFEILKLSIDARKKPDIKYIVSLGVKLKDDLENKFKDLIFEKFSKQLEFEKKASNKK